MEIVPENIKSSQVKPGVNSLGKEGGSFFSCPEAAPFFAPPVIVQPKLSVSQPGDPYEKEADEMAEKVMRMPAEKVMRMPAENNVKKEDKMATGGAPIRRSVTPFIRAKSGAGTTALPAHFSQSLTSSGNGGAALDDSTNSFMSERFGADFSRVRIHTNTRAVSLSNSIQAKAFTFGNDIYFNEGQYQPASDSGKRLLAHELTHVLQQEGSDAPDQIQRTVLDISDFDMSNTIAAVTAVTDPDYIDNGIIDWTMRSDGSVMSPTFTAFSLFYEDGTLFDIPASSNSSFPNLANPTGPTVTVHLKHNPTGKIFPITYAMNDFLSASDPTNISTIPNPQFLFLRRAGGTPNIITAYDQEIARLAFAYSGLIAQLWNVGLGVRGAIQIFQLSGALRAAAAARTATSGTGAVLGQAGPGVAGTGIGGAMSRVVSITINVIRRAAGLAPAELTAIQQAEARINTLLQQAINNVNSGTATGAWAQRLATTPVSGATYRMVLGNAIHEETFNLIQQDVANGALPAGIRTNIGRAAGGGLTNTFGRLRPDIRMPLSGGREAIFDITTTGQAGHAGKYTSFSFVDYISELLY